MSEQTITTESTSANAARRDIVLNDLRPSVIGEVLSRGWSDFLSAPWFGLFFGLVYAGGGWRL